MIKKFICAIILISAISFLGVAGQWLKATEEVRVDLSKDSYADSIGVNVLAGTNADFNAFRIQNSGARDIKIEWLKISRSGGTDNDLAAITLSLRNADGSRTPLSSAYLYSGVAFFNNLALLIPAASSKTIIVSATVPGNATAGNVLGLTIASTEHVGVTVVNNPDVSLIITNNVTTISRTVIGTGPDTTPPGSPTNFKVESVGTAPKLRLSWDDPSDSDLAKINIYRSTVQGQLGSIVFVSNRGVGIVPIKIYEDAGVGVNITYYYALKAIDTAGNESAAVIQSGIVYPKGLNISLDSSAPAAREINASSSDVDLAVFKLFASNADIEITNLKIDGLADSGGRNNLDQISQLKLYVDGSLTASSTGPTLLFYNDGTKLNISVNTNKVISLKADIPANAKNGAEIILKIAQLSAREPSWLPLSTYGLGTAGNKMTIKSSVATSPSPSPTPSPSPAPIPSSTPSSSPTPAPVGQVTNLPEGAMIRSIGDIDVYIIKYSGAKKFKRLILSPSVFNNYGHLKWSDIREVERSVVDAFVTSEIVRAVGDPKVYKLYPAGDTGQKRWIKTTEAFLLMGFDWDAIYEINSFDRDSYLTGENLE